MTIPMLVDLSCSWYTHLMSPLLILKATWSAVAAQSPRTSGAGSAASLRKRRPDWKFSTYFLQTDAGAESPIKAAAVCLL